MGDDKKDLDPEVWVDLHGDYLYRYAFLKVRNTDVSEDLVQETLMAGINSKKRFSGKSSVRTWLTGILKHKIIDYLRTSYREQPISELEFGDKTVEQLFDELGQWKKGVGNWESNPQKLAEQGEFVDAISVCLSKLPDRLAQAFALRVIDGMSTKEVCKIINVTSTNINVMLHRARLGLRQCLEVNWFD